MKSLRLEAVASLVKENCNVLDVGTDHAYLPIILSKTGKCQSIIASDVSNNALSYGEANLKKYHITNVKLVLSDGLKNIRDKYDTLTICGMGTYTIIDILKSGYLPKNIIISSNNDLYTLRCYLNSINYKIIKEIVIYENGKYYDIISYEKGQEKLSYYQKLYGKSNDKKYFNSPSCNLSVFFEAITVPFVSKIIALYQSSNLLSCSINLALSPSIF